jgi:alpha-tubulin suppressor-like RCC1 family protein
MVQLLLLWLAFAGAAMASPSGSDIVRENSKHLVVMIEAKVGSSRQEGAGIIVGSDRKALYIATADHVVREGGAAVEELTVRFRWSPKQQVPATLLPQHIARSAESESKLYDLAVVSVARSAVPDFDLEILPLDRLGDPALDRGADLYFIGFPQGRPWFGNVRPAKFAEPDGAQLTFETEALLPGYSGGALFDAGMALVGIVIDTEGSFGTAINIRAVAAALQAWNIPTQLGARPADLSLETLSAGYRFSCALDRKGFAHCWSGGLGRTTPDRDTEEHRRLDRLPGGIRFASLSVGYYHACGITAAGEAYCIGENDEGQLGSASKDQFSPYPEPVAGGHQFRAISAGETHSCGIDTAGKAYCWGERWGRYPVQVKGDQLFESISAGKHFSCALAKGRAWCWGQNGERQLGYAGKLTSASWTPTAIPMDPDISLKQISSGTSHSCATAKDGQVICWGNGGYGKTGNSKEGEAAAIPNRKFLSVTAGENSTCAIAIDRTAWCWGLASYGALGNGWAKVIENNDIKEEMHKEPVAVHGGHKFRALSAGLSYFACGITDQRDLLCWGRRNRMMDYRGDYGTTPQRVDY